MFLRLTTTGQISNWSWQGRFSGWVRLSQIIPLGSGNSYFPLFIFCWPKGGRACLIAQSQCYLRYDILKNKKFDVKKLVPKISEEFTIVIIWSIQMLGLKGSRYAPAVHYFLCAFSEKMAAYSLVIDNVHFVISS